MPEVANRDRKEKELAAAIWLTWLQWSNVSSPSNLRAGVLREIVHDNAARQLREHWDTGYRSVVDQFEVPRNSRRSQSMFTPRLANFENDLVQRWRQRILDYQREQADRSIDPARKRPPWEFVRGEGLHARRDEFGQWQARPKLVSPLDNRRVTGARPIVFPSDADRESVGLVTDVNTAGELFGKREAERVGPSRIEAFWHTDLDPCPQCAPLHGQPRRVWQRVAPNGPKLHHWCRCWLYYHRVLF